MDIDFRAVAPLLLLAVGLAVFALVDLVRAPAVRGRRVDAPRARCR